MRESEKPVVVIEPETITRVPTAEERQRLPVGQSIAAENPAPGRDRFFVSGFATINIFR